MATEFINPKANVPAPFRFVYDDGCTCLLCGAVRQKANEEASAYGAVTRLVKEYHALLVDELRPRSERLRRLAEINNEKEMAWDKIRRAKAWHHKARLDALEHHHRLRQSTAKQATKARF